ncbi:hypothetical protein ANANG_G00152690 [Anguilla anguilla]|uniref:Uncharacterized protein n=1 Tax=Anguilla anguilla TaxID=7936 RepID=A0A9D3M8I5_ANGAN|nr:hypothetical protein ANANG_G00152690 [Anguilla anguilla]
MHARLPLPSACLSVFGLQPESELRKRVPLPPAYLRSPESGESSAAPRCMRANQGRHAVKRPKLTPSAPHSEPLLLGGRLQAEGRARFEEGGPRGVNSGSGDETLRRSGACQKGRGVVWAASSGERCNLA